MSNFDTTLYGTNSATVLTNTTNDSDLENRLYFALLHKNINACTPLNSSNMTSCNNMYDNAETRINNQFNREYTNANSYVYSNPINAVFKNFSTSVHCIPEFGKNRTQSFTGTNNASYTFPIINSHDIYIRNGFTSANIQSIKNLKLNENITVTNIQTNESITFTRINDTIPEQYTLTKVLNCINRPYRTIDYINTLWTQTTECTQNLNNAILSNQNQNYDTLQYMPTEGTVLIPFEPFTKKNLIKNLNPTENIKLCYGDNGYLTIDDSNKLQYSARSILHAGFRFNKGITILSNDIYILVFQSDGNLVLYKNDRIRWSDTGKCFDIDGGKTANGTKVQTWDCNSNNNNQKISLQNGQIKWNNKCLDVAGGSTSNGTKVQTWDCANVDAQKGFSYQSDRIKWNNKCLDVDGGNTANGTQIQIWDCDSNNNNQKFLLFDAIWNSDTPGRGHTLVMQYDGNLVIYNTSGGAVWDSGTFNNNNAYLELNNSGLLYIKNSNKVIIKYLRGN